MVICPAGHTSTASRFCDVCGVAIPEPADTVPDLDVLETMGAVPCPECGTPRVVRFCEECGYDFATAMRAARRPEAGPVWRVVVAPDPAYYQAMVDGGLLAPDRLEFPRNAPQRRIRLAGRRMRIGRASAARGIAPEIDLGQPPADPGVSHEHAALVAGEEGAWSVVDLGSTNGTTINGTENPIERDVEVPVHDGDRIYVGAWTVITLQKG